MCTAPPQSRWPACRQGTPRYSHLRPARLTSLALFGGPVPSTCRGGPSPGTPAAPWQRWRWPAPCPRRREAGPLCSARRRGRRSRARPSTHCLGTGCERPERQRAISTHGIAHAATAQEEKAIAKGTYAPGGAAHKRDKAAYGNTCGTRLPVPHPKSAHGRLKLERTSGCVQYKCYGHAATRCNLSSCTMRCAMTHRATCVCGRRYTFRGRT